LREHSARQLPKLTGLLGTVRGLFRHCQAYARFENALKEKRLLGGNGGGRSRHPESAPLCKILKPDMRANSKASSEIPYATEQGIISAEQGILVQEQGIFPVKSEIITVHTGAISSHRPSKLDRCTCPPARMREPRVGRIRAKAAGSKSTYLKKRYLRF
jgi:hypothetical protein